MRGLTLWQPWASLVAHGAKEFETRSWRTKYRGPVLIHAARAKVSPYLDRDPRFVEEAIQVLGVADWDTLPKGAVVAVADLTNCVEIPPCFQGTPAASREVLFGNWAPGRFAWHLRRVERLERPVAVNGARGLWRPPAGFMDLVLRALEESRRG